MKSDVAGSDLNCVFSEPLDDVELLMYLDQQADIRIIAHLEQCPACRARAETLGNLDSALRAQAFRSSCPLPDELRDYYFRLLPSRQLQEIHQHLESCPHCTHELLTDYAEEIELPERASKGPDLLQQFKMLVARLVDVTQGSLAPALAVRDSGPGDRDKIWTQMYQAEENLISVVVRRDTVHPGTMVIEGQASILDLDLSSPALRVHLWQSNRLVATHVLDAAGDFVISELTPGQYELMLSGPAYKIHVPVLYVGLEPPLVM